MRVDAGHHGEESGIADAQHADFAAVVGDVLQQPVDGVAGVGGFVDVGFGGVRDDGAIHHELATGTVAAADVLEDEDVAAGGELGLAGCDAVRRCFGDAVGCALHEERQWRAGLLAAGGAEDDGVQLDAVARGDHDFGAGVGGVGRGCLS